MKSSNTFPREIPREGLLRKNQILGDRKNGIPPIIPVSSTNWNLGVKAGRYPQPVRLSPRCIAWRAEDIRRFVDQGPDA